MYELKKNLPDRYLTSAMLSAIRGPDSDNYDLTELKYELTGRIRALLFNYYPGVHNIHPMGAEGFSNAKTAIESLVLKRKHEHFLAHLCTAVFMCQDEPIWGSYGEDLHRILQTR